MLFLRSIANSSFLLVATSDNDLRKRNHGMAASCSFFFIHSFERRRQNKRHTIVNPIYFLLYNLETKAIFYNIDDE
jgi:hypothetical protein